MEPEPTDLTHDDIIAGLKKVQDHISDWVVAAGNGKTYLEDNWSYAPKGEGGGRTRVWEGTTSDFMEKAGVNFSAIAGKNLPASVLSFLQFVSPRARYIPLSFCSFSLFHRFYDNLIDKERR